MPFTYSNKSAGDLIRSQDWNAAMAGIAALFDKLHLSTGHRHTGTLEDGPKIDTAGLQDLAVTFEKLANLAVQTSKLADGAVTNPKLGNASVDGNKLANNSVNTAHIINGAVDINKLANNSVGNNQIANNAVTVGKIAANAVGNSQLLDLSVSFQKIIDNSVTTPKIADAQVTTAKIGDAQVTTAKIGDGQVTLAKLAAGAAPAIGLAMSLCYNNQTAAIPSGFLLSECKFFVAIGYIYFVIPNVNPGGSCHFYPTVDNNGLVTIYNYTTYSTNSAAQVLAIGKKGGW